MKTKEDKLQHDCFIWANNTHKEGICWAVRNETNRGAFYKSIGVRPGVSDLHYFHNGVYSVAELKTKNTRFAVDHILQQIRYIESILANKGRATFIYTLEEFQSFIRGENDYLENLLDMKIKCKQAMDKGVKSIKL